MPLKADLTCGVLAQPPIAPPLPMQSPPPAAATRAPGGKATGRKPLGAPAAVQQAGSGLQLDTGGTRSSAGMAAVWQQLQQHANVPVSGGQAENAPCVLFPPLLLMIL